MSSTKINQKEYLKKYLSSDKNGKDKKKKRKERPIARKSVTIIDDDIDLSKLHEISDKDLEVYAMGEDAPQIVGVVDDRPPELIAKEDYKNNGKWKVMANDDGFTSSLSIQHTDHEGKVSKSSSKRQNDDDDLSPPRKSKISSFKVGKRSPDLSPPRKKNYSSDSSPPRRRDRDASSRRDKSPQRNRRTSPDLSPPRKRNSSDASPPRRSRKYSDESPPRRKNSRPDSPRRKDRSNRSPPPRRSRDDSPPYIKKEKNRDSSPPRRKRSPDASPPRRKRSPVASPPRRKRSPDASPPRRRERSPDASPPRKRRTSPSVPRKSRWGAADIASSSADPSPPRRNRRNSDSSSPRRIEKSIKKEQSPPLYKRNSSSESPPPTHSKMSKTLDGKSAGLQNAKSLRKESDQFRKREEDLFNKMSAESSGRNAEAVVRDRRTGRIRDLEQEAEREHAKIQKEQERKAIYDRWGKGVKQVEDYRARMEDHQHEANKPLARYSDDKDLDELLRKKERDGDPMLAYIRNKEEQNDSGKPSKPIYRGSYAENRFSIRPGYRWDGVDRSNGYENKWFDVQSKAKAGEEEAYKYSVEDM